MWVSFLPFFTIFLFWYICTRIKVSCVSIRFDNYCKTRIFGGYYIWRLFKYMTIWQRINLAISNTGISKNCNIFIWRQVILAKFLNSPISSNKSSPIINCFTKIYLVIIVKPWKHYFIFTCVCRMLIALYLDSSCLCDCSSSSFNTSTS